VTAADSRTAFDVAGPVAAQGVPAGPRLLEPTPWLRPRLHASPAKAWMNDPNGLVFDGGRYHQYFQHFPDDMVPGPMSWGHLSSTDLVHWVEHPVAIPATPQEWVFSGCVVHADDGTLVAVYTAVDPATQRQTQALATSADGGATWRRHPANPVLDIGSLHHRDPKVFRHGDTWVMVVVQALEHVVELWTSRDLLGWELASTLGPIGPWYDEPTFWEMPDLVRVPVEGEPGRFAWVLLLSVNPGGPAGGSGQAYAVGDFDGRMFAPFDGDGDAFGPFSWADHGPDFYAATTFADPPDDLPDGSPREGAAVWIGWMSNWAYADVTPTAPWRGCATLARTLSLREVAGRLRPVQRPVLPTGRPLQPAATVTGALGSAGTVREVELLAIAPDAVRVRLDVSVPVGSAAGVDVLRGPGERTRVLVRAGTEGATVVVDRTCSGAMPDHPVFARVIEVPLLVAPPGSGGPVRTVLDIVVDTAGIEVFAADGATCLTALAFPAPTSRGIALVVAGEVVVHALDVAALA
jgi:sucrose-6-phosphate hydrolase SacC (GH32 family)